MENRLPNGWCATCLDQVSDWGSGGTPSRKNASYFSGNIPWIKTGELTGKYINDTEEKISIEALKKSSAKLFPAGSIGIAMYGATIGKLSIFQVEAATNQACAVASPFQNILFNEFLYYYLLSERRALINSGKGGAQPNISQGLLKDWPIWLPPFNEQKRIVAKIEELFSELDKGIESLQTAREQLKVYRQAVLKHAFEGKLTEQWRKDNADKLESPEQLLARIQQERDTRYQQQLEDWKAALKEWEANGKEGKKPGKPKEFLRQGEVDSGSQLVFDIPDEWKFELIGNIFSVHVGATPSRKNNQFWNGDISWVSSGEVAFGEIHVTNETITHAGYENTSTEIHPEGTVLLAMIGEGKTRGQAAILRISAAHNQNTAAVRVSEVGLPPEYIYYFLLYQYEQTRRVGSGNNQKALNKNRVASIQFPFCSAEEQIAVVQALSEKLSSIESVNQELEIQLTKAETLRQSILKKAFSGQLVPQDSNDEPASELLARIQAEKAALSAKAKKTPAKRARKAKEVSE
ncbi:restriction endonuclease subunit S [Neptunomonas phycophila]|uniref:Restriction endonuclease subunit S n=1 Tax=Neptunomonas phycophila TaxID=1572645 RepID=A0AAW7XGU5_9GAMM|nr:restriction endonuclease subunit S [Neptunomonas phycophila]MDO6453441.1 restriction endonuclease subunit S [Neptunomonas phycophila]